MNWDWRAVGIDRCTLFKEILGGVDGVQYDDNLTKNLERQDIPYRSDQKRTFSQGKVRAIYFCKSGVREPRKIAWDIEKIADDRQGSWTRWIGSSSPPSMVTDSPDSGKEQ